MCRALGEPWLSRCSSITGPCIYTDTMTATPVSDSVLEIQILTDHLFIVRFDRQERENLARSCRFHEGTHLAVCAHTVFEHFYAATGVIAQRPIGLCIGWPSRRRPTRTRSLPAATDIKLLPPAQILHIMVRGARDSAPRWSTCAIYVGGAYD